MMTLAMSQGLQSVLSVVIVSVVTALAPFVAMWFRAMQKAAQERAKQSNMDRKAQLMERLRSFLYGTAANIAEKRFPVLAQAVVDGRLTDPVAVRDELGKWGDELKQQAVEHFKGEDIDLAAEMSDQILDNLIERAANNASPTPGMKTSYVILQKEVSNALVDKGVEYVKQNVFNLVDGKLVPTK